MRQAGFSLALVLLSIGAALATVNVNSAQQSELQGLKGLDKYKAKAIIEYRAANGRFTSLEDLEKIPGFNKSVIDTIRAQVALTGDAFVPSKPEVNNKKK